MFIPPTHEGGLDEQYNIPYFQPTRLMAPCITNSQCNMSPIIPEYFMMFKSRQNGYNLPTKQNGLLIDPSQGLRIPEPKFSDPCHFYVPLYMFYPFLPFVCLSNKIIRILYPTNNNFYVHMPHQTIAA